MAHSSMYRRNYYCLDWLLESTPTCVDPNPYSVVAAVFFRIFDRAIDKLPFYVFSGERIDTTRCLLSKILLG